MQVLLGSDPIEKTNNVAREIDNSRLKTHDFDYKIIEKLIGSMDLSETFHTIRTNMAMRTARGKQDVVRQRYFSGAMNLLNVSHQKAAEIVGSNFAGVIFRFRIVAQDKKELCTCP